VVVKSDGLPDAKDRAVTIGADEMQIGLGFRFGPANCTIKVGEIVRNFDDNPLRGGDDLCFHGVMWLVLLV
jgi:hypothetical protein